MRVIDLNGQTAVVTGAAGGLGQAMAQALVEAGAKVWLWDVNAEGLAAAAATIDAPAQVNTKVVDVTSQGMIDEGAVAALADGPVSILINNCAIATAIPALKEPADNFMRVLDVNLVAQLRCCQAFMPTMIKRGYGRVVNISSAAGTMNFPWHASYNASKAGVVSLTKSLGKEYAATGVAMNCIVPGYFDTSMFRMARDKSGTDPVTPIGRIGQPSELAELALWLSSPLCSYSVGGVYDCSGGLAV